MRRSRSQLKNLSAYGSNGMSPGSQGNMALGANRHAEEIQRRINALGMPQQGPAYDQGGYYPAPQNPGYDQTGIHGYPAPMPGGNPAFAPQPHYPDANAAQYHPPMYADFPAPQPQYQSAPELDNLKASIERMSGKLFEMERMAGSGSPATGANQVSDSIGQNISAMANQINDLNRTMNALAANQPAKDDLAGFRQALDDASRAFSEFASKGSSSSIDPDAYASVVETSHSNLAQQIEEMRQSLSAANENPSIYTKTLEATHEDLKAQMQTLQQTVSANLGATTDEVGRLQEGHSGILSAIEQLNSIVIDNQNAGAGVGPEDISNIEMRLEEITRAIIAISHGGGNVDQMERLEARISDLAKSISASSGSVSFAATGDAGNFDVEGIKLELKALGEQVSNLAHAPKPETSSNDIAHHFAALSEKLDNIHAANSISSSTGDSDQLLARLDELVNRVGTSSDSETLARLTEEVGNLSARLSETTEGAGLAFAATSSADSTGLEAKLSEIISKLETAPQVDGLSEITNKLTSIEEQVASSRDVAIELANQAASEAVNHAVQQFQETAGAGGAMPDPGVLSELANDVRLLQETATKSSSDTLNTFDALRDTLEHMVGRLGRIEQSLQSQPVTAAAAFAATPSETSAYQEPEPEYQETAEVVHEPYADTGVFTDPLPMVEETAQAHIGADDFNAVLEGETSNPEPQQEPERSSIAQSLVEEANRAEEERQRLRAARAPQEPQHDELKAPNEREFLSENMAADSVEVPVDSYAELPEQATPQLAADAFPVADQMPETQADETPLEPGTAGPDLAALVRQANERRKTLAKSGADSSGTDFIAAARRAAQAAAEEASAAQDETVEAEKKESKGLMSALPDLFSKRKKAVMMAAGAALLAAIAIPIAGSMLGPDEPNVVAQSEPSITQQAEETESVFGTAPTSDEPIRVIEAPASENEVQNIEVASVTPSLEEESISGNSLEAPVTPSFANEVEINNVDLKSAIENGEPDALFEIGRRYMEGHGFKKDIGQASIWFERAADRGFAPAQYLLGNFSEKGIGTERNTAAAVSWYEKAAANGNIVAMHNLAVLHATPNGANEKPDLAQAFNWFKQAADFGVRDSQVNLGIFYTKGVGTEVNLIEAYKWFTLAAKAGDNDAENKRDVIAEALRPDQLAKAKELVEGWKPSETNQLANRVTPKANWTSDLASAPLPTNKTIVAKTQKMLAKLGYDAGPSDGIMGKKTRDAIAQFQQRVGLSINGEISAELLRELEAIAI